MTLFCALPLVFGCSSSDDEEQIAPVPEYVSNRLNYLNGSFLGKLHSETLNVTEYELVQFERYTTPKTFSGVQTGEVTSYGEAVLTSYKDDHLLETTKTCFIGFDEVDLENNGFCISFYEKKGNEIVGREDKRIINPLSETSFKMRRYGTTEETSLVYTKQK